jgi:uncharacterized protein YyaL (SSP411 family)
VNRLADQTSPYLRQHADNPVDWYAWGPDAFAAARLRDRPILLSIGYSACHWCHVMAHESFEDAAVAAHMNDAFVSVKVDREERPDVDSIYMEAVQAITGGGGWPMTVFLLPDGRPFHGGTYFPRDHFLQLMDQISGLWTQRRPDLEDAAAKLAEAVRRGTSLPGAGWAEPTESGPAGSPALLSATTDALLSRFDPQWGGFGRAPKFPQPPMLETLIRAYHRTGRADVFDAVTTTLDAMAAGGIYDHLGGGFARYSTDRAWLVPHFEKMLYDNALLARVYLHGWQVTGLARYRQVVEETLGYLLSPPMRLPDGGLASAEDADSEGVEGRFYVWDLSEVLDVGGQEAADWYGASPGGNWEGHNILHRRERGVLERPPAVESARAALFERRQKRVRPGLDDKVLTEWNAMAVAALAECGAAMQNAGWVEAGSQLARFLVDQMRSGDGRWRRSWQAGQARHLAYASDYAWLVEAFTRLAAATGEAAWIAEATQAADALIDLFWDGTAFVTTGGDAEQLIARPVDTQDGALPSANSVAATALQRLTGLTGIDRYRDHAHALIEAMGTAMGAAPVAFTGMVAAADLARTGLTEIVVTGSRPDLVAEVARRYLPEAVLAWGEPFDSPLWAGRTDAAAAGLAFVCRDFTCRAPVADADALGAALSTPSASAVTSMDGSVHEHRP